MSPNANTITVTNIDELPKSSVDNTFTNPKTGEQIVSRWTTIAARALVRYNAARTGNSFANDLANKVSLSPAQTFFFFKIAEAETSFIRGVNKGNSQKADGEYMSILELFTHAEGKLKRPAVVFDHNDQDVSVSIRISKAPETGKNPGCLYIKADGVYVGKITPAGEFYPTRECSEAVKGYVESLAENPVNCAKSYGKRTGRCCFCGLELTHGSSVSVGYGKICADHWGLPWGESDGNDSNEDSRPF